MEMSEVISHICGTFNSNDTVQMLYVIAAHNEEGGAGTKALQNMLTLTRKQHYTALEKLKELGAIKRGTGLNYILTTYGAVLISIFDEMYEVTTHQTKLQAYDIVKAAKIDNKEKIEETLIPAFVKKRLVELNEKNQRSKTAQGQ